MVWKLRWAGRVLALGPVLMLALLALLLAPLHAQAPEKRIAFVVGDAAYQAAALLTPANDAGLIAQTLQAAGFEVVGARDLDQAAFVNAWNDFLAKAQAAGPDAVAFVYLGGYALQLDGENYFASVDAQISTAADVATSAIRLADMTSSLASVPLKARILVLDAARANPFALGDPSVAGGLALVDPDDGTLIAFNAAPGTIAPEGQGPYGPYAQALAEMIGQGGLPLDEVFARTRMRVGETTKAAFMPWNASKISVAFMFRDGPPADAAVAQARAMVAKPAAELGPQAAFAVAERLDTPEGYQGFLAAYPDDRMAPWVRAALAARREAMVWRWSRGADTPEAYWTYLSRYPRGPHAGNARRRLAYLAAVLEPPPVFVAYPFEVPPPTALEIIYVERPVLAYWEPVWGFVAPPPPPIYFCPVINPLFVRLPPPYAAPGPMILPVPVIVPVIVDSRPVRPLRAVALPVILPQRLSTPQQTRLTPLVNPALRANPALVKPVSTTGPGPKPLVNPAIRPNELRAKPDSAKLAPFNPTLRANPNSTIKPLDATKLKPVDAAKLKPLDSTKPKPIDATKLKPLDATKPKPVDSQQVRVNPNANPTASKLTTAKPAITGNPPVQSRASIDANRAKFTTSSVNPQTPVTAKPVNPKPPVVNRPPPRQVHAAKPPPPCRGAACKR